MFSFVVFSVSYPDQVYVDIVAVKSSCLVETSCLITNFFIAFSLPGESCYSGKGRGYTGTVSTTETGRTCASWVSFYPHQHSLSPHAYPELLSE